jgi:ABC-type sulfate transport system permease subunit
MTLNKKQVKSITNKLNMYVRQCCLLKKLSSLDVVYSMIVPVTCGLIHSILFGSRGIVGFVHCVNLHRFVF